MNIEDMKELEHLLLRYQRHEAMTHDVRVSLRTILHNLRLRRGQRIRRAREAS